MLNGETISELKEIFSSEVLKTVNEVKELTIPVWAKTRFNSGEKVEIPMTIKNVPKILIKIFKLRPESFYLNSSFSEIHEEI